MKELPALDRLLIKHAVGDTYLLINPDGIVYLGATKNLRNRIGQHNKGSNPTAYTASRGPWHLLSYKCFNSVEAAFAYEKKLKDNPDLKAQWKCRHRDLASKIAKEYGYTFNPYNWSNPLEQKKLPTLKELLAVQKAFGFKS